MQTKIYIEYKKVTDINSPVTFILNDFNLQNLWRYAVTLYDNDILSFMYGENIKSINENNYKFIFNLTKTITTQYKIVKRNIIKSLSLIHTKYYKENNNYILSYYFPYFRGKHNNQQIENIIHNKILKYNIVILISLLKKQLK